MKFRKSTLIFVGNDFRSILKNSTNADGFVFMKGNFIPGKYFSLAFQRKGMGEMVGRFNNIGWSFIHNCAIPLLKVEHIVCILFYLMAALLVENTVDSYPFRQYFRRRCLRRHCFRRHSQSKHGVKFISKCNDELYEFIEQVFGNKELVSTA